MKKLLFAITVVVSASALARPLPTTPIEGNPWINYSCDLGTFALPSVRPGGAAWTEFQFVSQGNNGLYPGSTSPDASGVYTFTLSKDCVGDWSFGYPNRTVYAQANPLRERGASNATLIFDFAADGNHTFQTEYQRPWFCMGDVSQTTNENPTANIIYKGGRWDINEGYLSFGYSNASRTYPGGYYELNDGVVFTNLNAVYFSSQVSDGLLVMTNGACITADVGSGYAYFFRPGKYNESNSRVVIAGGSKVVSKGPMYMDIVSTSNPADVKRNFNDKLLITGAGTEVISRNAAYIANQINGVSVKVDDNALFQVDGYAYIGLQSHVTNVHFEVDRGATARFKKYLFLGHTVGCDNNLISVNNGATIEFSDSTTLRLGGSDKMGANFNRMVITNANVICGGLEVGFMGSVSNGVYFVGKQSTLHVNPTEWNPFRYGKESTLSFDNCDIDTSGTGYRLYATNVNWTGNQMVLKNGTTLRSQWVKYGSPGSSWEKDGAGKLMSFPANGMTITVADSTWQVADQYMSSSRDCSLVLSNGTLFVQGQYAIYMGYVDATYTTHVNTNNYVVFQGAKPKIRTSYAGAQSNYQSTIFRFELSADEGVYKEPPVKGSRVEIRDTCDIEFGGLGAIQRSIDKAVEVPLFESDGASGTKLDMPDTIINRANANLPTGCYLYRKGTLAVNLHLAATPGMRVIVR